MKKCSLFLLLPIFILIFSACGPSPTPSASPQQPEVQPTALPESPTQTSPPPTPTPAPEVGVLDVYTQANSRDEKLTDVFIRNTITGEEALLLTLEDVYAEHYHNSEYRNSNLYIIKRVGYDEDDPDDDDWTDEIWKYDDKGIGVKLFTSRGVDFRVAPDESLVAVRYRLSPEFEDSALAFINPQGELIRQFLFDNIEITSWFFLDKWSDDGSSFWVVFQFGPSPKIYSRIDLKSWQVVDFDVIDLQISHEDDLNANTGKLVYSDHPFSFETFSAQKFLVSQELVTLFVYDFTNKKSTAIATSIARQFKPTWLDDNTIEYDDPDRQGRIVHDLIANTTTLIPSESTGMDVFPQVIPPEFEHYMQDLALTGIPPMLPATFPVADGSPAVYPHIYTVIDGKYEISLDYGEDCHGAGACHYGSLAARRIGASGDAATTMMPFSGEMPMETSCSLENQNHMPCYFVASVCEANCSDAQVFWIYGDYEYMVGLKGAAKEDVILLANQTVTNSIP